MTTTEPSAKHSLPVIQNFSRRTAVKGGFATLGAAAFVAASSPASPGCQEFLGGRVHADPLHRALTRTESGRDCSVGIRSQRKLGAEVTIADDRPIPGTKFVYAINLSVCNGNGKCVEACHKENNHDRDTNQSYIRVLEMPKGTMDMEQGSTTYTGNVPKEDKFYLPVQCQQCDEPPCVNVCEGDMEGRGWDRRG